MVDIFKAEGIEYNASKPQGRDLFAEEGVEPPSIAERNDAAMSAGIRLDAPSDEVQQSVVDAVKQDQTDIEAIAKTRFTPEQIAEFKKNPIGFWDSFHLAIPIYTEGKKAVDLYNINSIASKHEAGEELTEEEQQKLGAFLDNHIETTMRGTTLGGDIAYGVSEVPAFAIELLASGGIGKIVQKAAFKGATKVAEKAAVKAATSVAMKKVAGAAIKTAAFSAVAAPRVSANYQERRVSDAMTVTDKGELILRESTESPAKSAMLAYGYTMAEVASEFSGKVIGRYVDPLVGRLKTPLVAAANKLPVGLKEALYSAYKKIQPNAQVSKVFSVAGWNGMLNELGEERVSDVMKAFIGVASNDKQAAQDKQEYTAKDFFDAVTPSGDQLLVEAGIVSLAGGVKTSADLTFNLLKNMGVDPAKAKEMTDNLTATEQEQFVADNLKEPTSSFQEIDGAKPKYTLSQATDENLSHWGLPKPKDNVVYSINDEAGNNIGFVDAKIEGNTAIINDIVSMDENGKTSNSIGTSGMRELLRSFRQSNPDVTTISGERVSGARKDGQHGFESSGVGVSVSLHELEDEEEQQDTTIQMFDAATKKESEVDPPKIDHEQSMADKFISQFRNDLWALHKVGDMAQSVGATVQGFAAKKFSPIELVSRMFSSTLTQARWAIDHGAFYYTKAGEAIRTAKGLKPILDDFDNYFMEHEPDSETRRADLKDYLIAQRYMQDLVNKENVEVTEEQKLKSVVDLTRLTEKYGEHMKFFEVFAQELYDFQKAVLYRFVASGNMTEEKYNKIVSANPHYIPFQRVMDENDIMSVVRNNPMFDNATASKAVKTLHGSEKDVKDPIASIIMNTHKITSLALANEVAVQLSEYAEVFPQYVQEAKKQMVKTGTAKTKVTYDKKLREKLKAAIDYFSHSFEQKKTLNKRGQLGYIRGDYSPMEKLVRLRLGSSDAVLTHEVGHMLDFELGLKGKMLTDEKVKAELQKLAEERMSTKTNLDTTKATPVFEDIQKETESQKHIDYLKNDREVLANMFDAYVNAPELLDKIAPTAKAMFEKILDSNPELSFIKEIKPSLERAEEEVETDFWGESPYAPQGSITVFKDGVKKYYMVSKPILEACKHLHPSQLNLFERLFVRPLMNVFRMGAALTPEFMTLSLFREGHSAMLSGVDVKFNPLNYARGFMAVLQSAVGSQNDLYKEFSRSARFNDYYQITEQSATEIFSSLVSGEGRVWHYARNPLSILEEVGMKIDQIAKVGAYDAARRSGFSEMEAALISRDIFDYSRGGSAVKKANEYIPFLKAAINGSDKLYRAFKDRPFETAFWATTTITIPSLAIASYYLYFAPDDERKEYLEINKNLRNTFWFYKVNGEWRKHPKPFQLGQLFGSVPEQILLWMYEEGKPEGKEVAKTLIGGLVESASPISDWSSVIPLVVKIPAEWASNYNFYLGKDIYPSFLNGKDPQHRVNPWNSETSKELGKAFGLSPALIDNAIRGVTAGGGDYITKATDAGVMALREWNGEKTPTKPITPSDVMIIRALSQRRPAGFRSESYIKFSELQKRSAEKVASMKDLEGEKRAEWMKENRREIASSKMLSASKKEISEIGKQINGIYEHKTMTSEEKVKRINALEDRITEIARRANKGYNKTKGE